MATGIQIVLQESGLVLSSAASQMPMSSDYSRLL